jgi:Zn-dependent peptidase ImmA (M78 family)
MEANYKFAKDKARHVIKKYNLNSVPIDLDNIFTALRYKKIEINKPNGIDGAIMEVKGKGMIVAINKAKTNNRVRFTLAHELGHFFLHHDKRDYYDSEEERQFEDFPNSKSSIAKPARESEADVFASELLIPLEQLKKYVKKGHNINELAEIFQVSKHAMSIAYQNNWRYLK